MKLYDDSLLLIIFFMLLFDMCSTQTQIENIEKKIDKIIQVQEKTK